MVMDSLHAVAFSLLEANFLYDLCLIQILFPDALMQKIILKYCPQSNSHSILGLFRSGNQHSSFYRSINTADQELKAFVLLV